MQRLKHLACINIRVYLSAAQGRVGRWTHVGADVGPAALSLTGAGRSFLLSFWLLLGQMQMIMFTWGLFNILYASAFSSIGYLICEAIFRVLSIRMCFFKYKSCFVVEERKLRTTVFIWAESNNASPRGK